MVTAVLCNREQNLPQFYRIRGGGGGGDGDGSDDQEGRSVMTRDTHRRVSSVSTPSSASSGDGADGEDLDDSSTSVESGGGTGVSGVSMTSTVADLVNSECSGGAKGDRDEEEAGYGSGMTLIPED